MKNYCFDIETVPLPTDQLEAMIPAFDPESVKVGNLREETAQIKIEKAKHEHFQTFYKRAALSALTGTIAMIGVRDDDGTARIMEGVERDIIQEWLDLFDSEKPKHFFGFGIRDFDVPFLLRRAWFYRLRVPYGIVRNHHYLSGLLTDLLELWQLSERGQERFPVSLNDLACYFGIGAKTASGAQFHELLRYKPEEARNYLLNDLEITWKIAEAMGAIRGPIPEPAPLAEEPAALAEAQSNSTQSQHRVEQILFY